MLIQYKRFVKRKIRLSKIPWFAFSISAVAFVFLLAQGHDLLGGVSGIRQEELRRA